MDKLSCQLHNMKNRLKGYYVKQIFRIVMYLNIYYNMDKKWI